MPQAEIDRAAVVSKVRATVVCNVPFMVERSILRVHAFEYGRFRLIRQGDEERVDFTV